MALGGMSSADKQMLSGNVLGPISVELPQPQVSNVDSLNSPALTVMCFEADRQSSARPKQRQAPLLCFLQALFSFMAVFFFFWGLYSPFIQFSLKLLCGICLRTWKLKISTLDHYWRMLEKLFLLQIKVSEVKIQYSVSSSPFKMSERFQKICLKTHKLKGQTMCKILPI